MAREKDRDIKSLKFCLSNQELKEIRDSCVVDEFYWYGSEAATRKVKDLVSTISTLLAEIDRLQSELSELTRCKEEGRLIILPSKGEEIIRIVEFALRIKLYDWQKAYILGVSNYEMPGRASGKTTAYMVKLCLSEGETIDLTKLGEYIDEVHGSAYLEWFRHELFRVYRSLREVGGLKLRTITWGKPK